MVFFGGVTAVELHSILDLVFNYVGLPWRYRCRFEKDSCADPFPSAPDLIT